MKSIEASSANFERIVEEYVRRRRIVRYLDGVTRLTGFVGVVLWPTAPWLITLLFPLSFAISIYATFSKERYCLAIAVFLNGLENIPLDFVRVWCEMLGVDLRRLVPPATITASLIVRQWFVDWWDAMFLWLYLLTFPIVQLRWLGAILLGCFLGASFVSIRKTFVGTKRMNEKLVEMQSRVNERQLSV